MRHELPNANCTVPIGEDRFDVAQYAAMNRERNDLRPRHDLAGLDDLAVIERIHARAVQGIHSLEAISIHL